jgi:hypothetical protein
MPTTRARRTNRVPGHRIAWWVWGWGPQGSYKIRHNDRMRGTQSRTGGATKGSVDRDVFGHMWNVADDAQRDQLIGLDR